MRADTWVERYAEPDKAAARPRRRRRTPGRCRTGGSTAAWRSEHLLLGAVDAGLGACFFGLFGHEADVLAGLGVPDGWRSLGTVALGHPAPDAPGLSASRPRRSVDEVLHRGGW